MGHVTMQQVNVDAPGKNGRSVILNDDAKTAREIAGGACIESDNRLFAQKTMRLPPARGRAALMWITVAFLATTWASETQGFPEARHAQSDALANTRHAIAARNGDFGGTAGDHDFETQVSRFGDKSVLVAQATRGDTDTEELQKALEQEHRRSELLIRDLCKSLQGDRADRLEPAAESDAAELKKSLQQESERVERLEQDLAVARRDVETQTALAAKANDDATQLKQVAESDAAELRKSQQQERERAERLEQDLAAARRDVETQTALAAKANDDATQLKQVAEGDAAELRKSQQQGRERAERLEQDLAAARRDVETQTALATRANDDATELKQVAESGSAELKRSLQKEHDRAETLSQDLSMARATIYAYDAQAGKAGEQAADLKQAAESGTTELRKSLEQERERAGRLKQDLAAARRDVETQTALATRANDDATELKQVAESGSAELKRSLQKEHDRAETLAQDLSMARTTIYAYDAQARKASDQAADLKQAAESSAAELGKSLQQERERAAQLQQDLAAARREVETALAAKETTEATQLKQFAENGAAGLKQSLQQEHDSAESLAQELSMTRTKIYAYEAQARKDSDQATDLNQGAESGTAELRKSLQQERERAERLEQDLAAARRDIETQTALASKASQEASQLKQVAEVGSAELKRSLQQEHDKAEALAQDLSTARTKIYAYEAQARKVGEQAADLKQAAESGAAELRKSLQQERERAARLEQDLAAARRDVEAQTALAAKANEDATQLKQVAERGSAELKRSLQKEHDRAEALAQDLSTARTKIYAYEAQTPNASDRAAGLKQAQTALAAKAGAEAARLRQVAENGSAELKRSLQQERDRGARLERELVSERKAKAAPAVSAVVTAGQVMQDKQVGPDAGDREGQTAGRARPRCRAAYSLGWLLGLVDVEDVIFRDSCIGFARSGPGPKPVAADQATVAKARGEAQLTPGDAAEVARLVARASVLLSQGDIGSARIVLERAAERGSAQASFTLAETYDPLMLLKWGTYGTRGDAAKARDLYAKAQAGGIKEATERLDALRR